MVIIFQIPEARDQLLTKGTVVTVRHMDHRRVGMDWATDHRGGKKIANVYIKFLEKATSSKLKSAMARYLEHSGFGDVEKWYKVAVSPTHISYKIYRVTKV